MVWTDVALVAVGAVAGVGASAVQRWGERQARLRDRSEEQTRTALLAVADQVHTLCRSAEKRMVDLDRQVEVTIDVLRRQGRLVTDTGLRARIELATACLEWNKAITASRLGAGIVYLTRYISGDLEPAIGAYLRREPVPPRSERMRDCEEVLMEEWATGEHC